MSTSKIRIKYGQIEIDYDGSEEFFKTELPSILSGIAVLHGSAPPASTKGAPGENGSGTGAPPPSGTQVTTNTIAAKLGAESGPDLAKAAALRLMLHGGRATFSRAELTKEMRGATNYFKRTYGKNLSATLSRLLADNVLLESSPGVYALDASAFQSLRAKVGG